MFACGRAHRSGKVPLSLVREWKPPLVPGISFLREICQRNLVAQRVKKFHEINFLFSDFPLIELLETGIGWVDAFEKRIAEQPHEAVSVGDELADFGRQHHLPGRQLGILFARARRGR